MKEKVSLRRHFQAARRAMPVDVFDNKNSKLVQRVIAHIEWSHVKTLHCFLPLVGSNEPDMRQVIKFALSQGATVYTTNPGGDIMELEGGLQHNLHNYELSDTVQFDVIIVPMLAYDPATKHRLGFGGGFYDRMLAGQHGARKIGVCFSEFAVELPIEPHDQPLDDIIVV